MTDLSNAEGLAALGICESLLLALTDLKILDEKGVRALLTDVVSTHREAEATSASTSVAGRHQAAAEIVERILNGRNGVRHVEP
jgi:hypothetical protein